MSNLFAELGYYPTGIGTLILRRRRAALPKAWAEPVAFHNPLTDRPFLYTVYWARAAGEQAA